MKVGWPFVGGFFHADGWDWKLIGRYAKLMRQPVFANAEDVHFFFALGWIGRLVWDGHRCVLPVLKALTCFLYVAACERFEGGMPTLENALRVHCFDFFFNPLDGQRVQVVPRTMRYAGDYKTATGQESSRDASSCLEYLRIIACRHSVFSNQRLVPNIRVQKHPKTP